MAIPSHTGSSWLIMLGWFVMLFPDALGQSTLSGTIKDNRSGEPVPFANIFFAHTTLGTSSLADGTFMIHRIPNGKYDLLVEVVGFHRHKQPLEFQGGSYHIEIGMAQDTVLLDSIVVVADQSDKRYFSIFSRFFVGDGANAKQCKIQNPEALHFFFDKKKNYLTVHAREPIRVTNPELGYTVHYILDLFGLDFTTGAKIMEGSPRFEELPVRSRKDSVSRQKKRNKAYQGSLYHLMRSLYSNSLKSNKFNVFLADSTLSYGSSDKVEVARPFKLEEFLSGTEVKELRYQGLLKVEYQDKEDWAYPGSGRGLFKGTNPYGYQQTYLRLRNPSLQLYENGYYSDQKSVYLTGYLVWKETVSNMVPLGQEVMTKKKNKKKRKG